MARPVFLVNLSMALAGLAVCLWHAVGDRERVARLVTATVYGVLLEQLVILRFERYVYSLSEFVLTVGEVPLVIGFGWGAIVYSGVELAETLGVGSRVRPLFVGLFGLHIDVAIDAVAIRVPFWQWTPPGVWFGVPLGNFVGWFLVASLFPAAWSLLGARLSRADSRGVVGLREISGGGGLEASGEGRSEASGDSPLGLVASAAVAVGSCVATILLAVGSCVATILLAVAGLIVGLELWEAVTPSLTAEVIVLGTTVTLSAVAVLRAGFEPSTPDVRVTAVPVLYHVAYLGYFFWLGMYRETPALLGVGLAMLALTALLHWSGAPRVRRLLPAG